MITRYQPGLRISEYILESLLGRGAFGEVWQARHHVWDSERVAVKLPTEPDYVRYLRSEGIVVHGLRHPNIVRVIGLDPYADTPYLVMELVSGPSLRDVINQHPKGVGLPVLLTILRGVLTGLGVAHSGGVIHRDLKPGNVLLNLGPRSLVELRVEDVKVGDFGLGVKTEDDLRSIVMQSASIARDEQGSQLAGTLAYMAPEVRDGRLPPDARSDLYAVGVILFELLTGERPAGAELPSTLRADTPPTLDEVFRRLYARHERRFESAAEVLQILEQEAAPRGAAPARPPVDSVTLGGLTRCPGCGGAVEPEDNFCTHCGVQLVDQIVRCSACGAYPGPFDRYCIYCGAALAAPRG